MARLAASSDLPTPPLPPPMAMMRRSGPVGGGGVGRSAAEETSSASAGSTTRRSYPGTSRPRNVSSAAGAGVEAAGHVIGAKREIEVPGDVLADVDGLDGDAATT